MLTTILVGPVHSRGDDLKTVNGKVAVVTGAGSGIGRALALELARRGCAIALADVGEAGLSETHQLLEDTGQIHSTHLLDVADRMAVEAFAAEVVRRHGHVNFVFNNAGVSVTDDVEHLNYDDFHWLMGVNFWGVVHGTKAFLPYLRQVHDAHIVNTASIFGVIAYPRQAAYNASKFAVRGFTEALRQELADSHISVSCVMPGGVKTNIVSASRYYANGDAPNREDFVSRFEQVAALTPAQAALRILHGVSRKQAHILVGRDARMMAWIQRLLPSGYLRLLGALRRREAGKARRSDPKEQPGQET